MNLRNNKHRHRHVVLRVFVAALLVASSNLYADAGDINFAGFASLVYGKALSDPDETTDGVDTHDNNTVEGYTLDGDFREDTKLGLRMDADLGKNISIGAQVVAYGENDYDPTFDWIYAAIELTPEIVLSVGKLRVPLFMYSDYKDVSYAYQWIALPNSVYSVPPFQSYDGLQFSYATDIGSWVSELTIWTGEIDEEIKINNLDAVMTVDEMLGIAWAVERDWLTMRFVYVDVVSSLDITTNSDGVALVALIQGVEDTLLANFGQNVDLLDDILWEDDEGEFYGVGLGLNFEKVFFQAEVSEIEVDHTFVVGDLRGAYAILGYRLTDEWTVSVTWAEDFNRTKQEILNQYIEGAASLLVIEPDIVAVGSGSDTTYVDQNGVDQTSFGSAVNDNLAPLQEGGGVGAPNGVNDAVEVGLIINAAMNKFQQYETEVFTYSARWDFHSEAALKFEYITEERAYDENKKTSSDAFRIGLDLVF